MLNPEQIQAARAKLGLNIGPNSSVSGAAPVSSPTGLKGPDLASWATSIATPTVEEKPKSINYVEKLGAAATEHIGVPLATGLVNTGMALRDRIGKVFDHAISQGVIDKDKSALEKTAGIAKEAAHGVIDVIGGGAGDIITNMISPFIPDRVKQVYGEETDKALNDLKQWWDTPAQNPEDEKSRQELHSMLDSLTQKAKENPELTQSLGDAVTVALLGVGSKGAGAAKGAAETAIDATVNTAKKGAEKLAPVIADLKQAGSEVVSKVKANNADFAVKSAAKNAVKAADQSVTDAQKILNPTGYYTTGEKEAALKSSEIKVKGKGPFKKEVVAPKPDTQTDLISQLVREGAAKVKSGEAKIGDVISPKNLPSQNIGVIEREARITDSGIDEFVHKPELNKPFTQSAVDKTLKNLSQTAKDNLTFVSDTTEEKAYNEVVRLAKEEIAKQSYNSAGLRTAIKSFNKRMENILGNDIYGDASESIGKARLQAAKDTRTSLNRMLADNLESPMIKKTLTDKKVVNKLPASSEYNTGKMQGGSVYRSQLEREAKLLNSRDEIAYRATKQLDKSKVKQFFEKHPATRKAVKAGTLIIGSGVLGGSLLHHFGL